MPQVERTVDISRLRKVVESASAFPVRKLPELNNNEVSDYEERARREAEYWGEEADGALSEGYSPDLRVPFRRSVVLSIWDDSELNMMIRGRYIEKILECCSKERGLRCLELCCGIGTLSLEAARRGAQVTAVDISERCIQIASEYAKKKGVLPDRLSYRVDDLNSVLLPEGGYDVIYVWDGLHHIEKIERLMGEVNRGLKEGGVFVVHDHAKDVSRRGRLFRFACSPLIRLFGTSNRSEEPGSVKREPFEESPFEDVSGENIVRSVSNALNVLEFERYMAFPGGLYAAVGRDEKNRKGRIGLLLKLDRLLSKMGIVRPEYFFMLAEKKRANGVPPARN